MIAGLVELGRDEEAIELAGSEAASAQDLLGRLGEGIEEPVLVALLLGKTATARERGVTLHGASRARACARASRRPTSPRSSATSSTTRSTRSARTATARCSVALARRRRDRDDRGPRRRPRPARTSDVLRARRDHEAARARSAAASGSRSSAAPRPRSAGRCDGAQRGRRVFTRRRCPHARERGAGVGRDPHPDRRRRRPRAPTSTAATSSKVDGFAVVGDRPPRHRGAARASSTTSPT